jgi:hypothetical protein
MAEVIEAGAVSQAATCALAVGSGKHKASSNLGSE